VAVGGAEAGLRTQSAEMKSAASFTTAGKSLSQKRLHKLHSFGFEFV
jgi:hypothetical protein